MLAEGSRCEASCPKLSSKDAEISFRRGALSLEGRESFISSGSFTIMHYRIIAGHGYYASRRSRRYTPQNALTVHTIGDPFLPNRNRG